MIQEKIKINDVEIPIVNERGENWYPISYMGNKVLLKNLAVSQFKKNGYEKYIKQYKIDFGENTGGVQNSTNCINRPGLKEILGNSKIGKLSIEQKIAMNGLLKYLGMKQINIDDRFIEFVSEDTIKGYNEYVQDCIQEILTEDKSIKWQKCTKCNCYYPYHLNFFKKNLHSGKDCELYTVCRCCNGWDEGRSKGDIFRVYNDNLRLAYKRYGLQYYIDCKTHNVLNIYNHWIQSKVIYIPLFIDNDEDKLQIIKYLFKEGKFDNYNTFNPKIIKEVTNINIRSKNFIDKIINELNSIKSRNGVEYVNNIARAREIFFEYLVQNNINTEEQIFDLKYEQIFKGSNLRGYLRRNGNNILTLIMNLFENKYPAYKFKIKSLKYWDIKYNRNLALECLIKEMNIPLEKLPLYLTLTSIRKFVGNNTMYNVLKKYYKNLFQWANDIYPDKFIESDFNINLIRNEFDSINEQTIDDILNKNLKNVFYNNRNTENTITINGMQPDWFVITDTKVYIIEYFGMYQAKGYNTRINDYIDKTEEKIFKYDKLEYYEKIYLFPNDLKNGFSGLMDKIKNIN